MKSTIPYVTAFALFSAALAASGETKPPPLKPCTIRSPTTGAFFDLNPLRLEPVKNDDKSKKTGVAESWSARGWDYGTNFTLNICSPVVEPLEEVNGVDSQDRHNVSAYYVKNKMVYSIGSLNTELVFRGRKLVLNYTHGSPCKPKTSTKRSLISDLQRRADDKKPEVTRHKSTTISFLCDTSTLDPGSPKVQFSFVGTDEDECSYFFEARSSAACAGIETTSQQLGPGGVFGVILLIALLVYFLGGCVYQRTVMHKRGWEQLPNYYMWAYSFGFVVGIFQMIYRGIRRIIPDRRGNYSRVSFNSNDARGRGIYPSPDDENRLIDQLDDEWDD